MVGPYRLSRTLGEGSFGKVKCKIHFKQFSSIVGINDDTKDKVAIKIIEKRRLMRRMSANIGGDAGSVIECVKKEIKMFSRFSGQHPNIIKLLDVIESRETVCTVMEYCSGGEYFDLIAKHGRIAETEAKLFFR